MNDTPETSAAEERCIATGFKTGYVDVELACKLERERDEARHAFAIVTNQCTMAHSSKRQWRECAEGMAAALKQMRDIPDYAEFALTQFDKLKENK
jgi:hypothetical protein